MTDIQREFRFSLNVMFLAADEAQRGRRAVQLLWPLCLYRWVPPVNPQKGTGASFRLPLASSTMVHCTSHVRAYVLQFNLESFGNGSRRFCFKFPYQPKQGTLTKRHKLVATRLQVLLSPENADELVYVSDEGGIELSS